MRYGPSGSMVTVVALADPDLHQILTRFDLAPVRNDQTDSSHAASSTPRTGCRTAAALLVS